MITQNKQPYDLEKLDPGELEELLHKRPDLRKEIFAEADRRVALAAEAARTGQSI